MLKVIMVCESSVTQCGSVSMLEGRKRGVLTLRDGVRTGEMR
jgi:hypothetical protein